MRYFLTSLLLAVIVSSVAGKGSGGTSNPKSSSKSHSREEERRDSSCCTCDSNVYTFGYGFNWPPFEYIENGELKGFSLDVVKAVCDEMDKKCEHTVYFDYSVSWNDDNQAPALNNNWFMASVGLIQTDIRSLVYNFLGTYAPEPLGFLYADVDDATYTDFASVTGNSPNIGFLNGFRLNRACLENELSFNLNDGKIHMYPDVPSMLADLGTTIDLMFVDGIAIPAASVADVKQVGNSFQCADGGVALAVRKELSCRFKWFEEGLQKIIANGVYDNLCDAVKADSPSFACLAAP